MKLLYNYDNNKIDKEQSISILFVTNKNRLQNEKNN
jgi:hypothetical protein